MTLCECGCGEQPNPGKRFVIYHNGRMKRAKQGTPEERFWVKVEKTPICWLWVGATTVRGYGRFFDGERLVLAHRWSYEQAKGPIPRGLQVDHLCRTINCVNPDHLEAVTQRENVLRGESHVAQQARQTHCHRGHLLSGPNLRVRKGKRSCRTCQTMHDLMRKGTAPAHALVAAEARWAYSTSETHQPQLEGFLL